MIKICKCGHTYDQHTRATGPNSIGQHWFNQCGVGWETVGGFYMFPVDGKDCKCEGYRRDLFKSILTTVVEKLNERRYPC